MYLLKQCLKLTLQLLTCVKMPNQNGICKKDREKENIRACVEFYTPSYL